MKLLTIRIHHAGAGNKTQLAQEVNCQIEDALHALLVLLIEACDRELNAEYLENELIVNLHPQKGGRKAEA
jgi:hypothetical protein